MKFSFDYGYDMELQRYEHACTQRWLIIRISLDCVNVWEKRGTGGGLGIFLSEMCDGKLKGKITVKNSRYRYKKFAYDTCTSIFSLFLFYTVVTKPDFMLFVWLLSFVKYKILKKCILIGYKSHFLYNSMKT